MTRKQIVFRDHIFSIGIHIMSQRLCYTEKQKACYIDREKCGNSTNSHCNALIKNLAGCKD